MIRVDGSSMYAIVDKNVHNCVQDITEIIAIQYDFLNSKCKKLCFEFTDCEHLNAAVSVIIGTLPEYARLCEKRVKYHFPDQTNHPIFKFMKKVGMYKYYMKDEIDYTGDDVIPFDCIIDEDMMDKYADMIMSLAPIQMQKEAQDILSSYIYEIYQNSLFHSNSPIGVFTSGCWMKNKKEFAFSIYDMGMGIPETIRKYMKMSSLDSEKCLKLAFLDGFSTSSNHSINRGLGLTRLESFIRLNKGRMSIYTDDICCLIQGCQEKEFIKLDKPIKGTLIIVNIMADEKHIYVIDKERKV